MTLVVALHDDLGTEFGKELVEVVGEAVVVIDEQRGHRVEALLAVQVFGDCAEGGGELFRRVAVPAAVEVELGFEVFGVPRGGRAEIERVAGAWLAHERDEEVAVARRTGEACNLREQRDEHELKAAIAVEAHADVRELFGERSGHRAASTSPRSASSSPGALMVWSGMASRSSSRSMVPQSAATEVQPALRAAQMSAGLSPTKRN